MTYVKKGHDTHDSPSYSPVGRQKELSDLVAILNNKSAAILGNRGMGKTFLIDMYRRAYSKDYSRIISINCKKGTAPFHVFNQIAETLTPETPKIFDENSFRQIAEVDILVGGSSMFSYPGEGDDVRLSNISAVTMFIKDFSAKQKEDWYGQDAQHLGEDELRTDHFQAEGFTILYTSYENVLFFAIIVGESNARINKNFRSVASTLKTKYHKQTAEWGGEIFSHEVLDKLEKKDPAHPNVTMRALLRDFVENSSDYVSSEDTVNFVKPQVLDYLKPILSKKVLFILDNCQNLDLETLKFLEEVVSKKTEARFIFARNTDEEIGSAEALHFNAITDNCGTIHLKKYSPEDLEAIVKNLLKTRSLNLDAAQFRQLLEYSEGNPRRVAELLENMSPEDIKKGKLRISLDEVITRRLEHLGEFSVSKLHALQILSAINRRVTFDELYAICKENKIVSGKKLQGFLDYLEKAGFISLEKENQTTWIGFSNPDIRKIIYEGIGKHDQYALHQELGTWFEKKDPILYISDIIWHYKSAGLSRMAINTIIKHAEEEYLKNYDANSLLQEYKDAVKVSEKTKVPAKYYLLLYSKIFQAAWDLHDFPTIDEYTKKLQAATSNESVEIKQRVAIKIGLALSSVLYNKESAYEKARDILKKGIAATESLLKGQEKDAWDTARDLGQMYYLLTACYYSLGKFKKALSIAKKGKALPEKPELLDVIANNYYVSAVVNREVNLDDAFSDVKTAISLVKQDKSIRAKFLTNLTSNYVYLGDKLFHEGKEAEAKKAYLECISRCIEGESLSRDINNENNLLFFFERKAESQVKSGDLDQALVTLEKARILAEKYKDQEELFYLLSIKGMVLSRQRKLREMRSHFKKLLKDLSTVKGQDPKSLKKIYMTVSFDFGYELYSHSETRKEAIPPLNEALKIADRGSWMYSACKKYLAEINS